MDKLSTTLLTGAAMSALTVAPAMAGIHVPGHDHLPLGQSHGMAVKTAKGVQFLNNLHSKTNVLHTPGGVKTNFYTTYTFTTGFGFCYHTVATCSGSRTWNYNGAFSTWHKVPMDLAGSVAWESSTCVAITSRFYSCNIRNAAGSKAKGHATGGKLKSYSTAIHGSYTYTFTTGFRERIVTNITFHGPKYTLKNTTQSSESGAYAVTDKLSFVYYTTTTGAKHKRKKHTETFNGTINMNLAMHFD
jgi:hypothetical protein